MSVTLETLKHTAELARLDLSLLPTEEQNRLAEQMSRILAFVDQLSEVDVEGEEPMTHPIALPTTLAADVVVPAPGAAVMLANAPARSGDEIVVPRVLDGGGEGG
jgi:aspartyl-tRNA(Asn)/glutamyl-tRNA(Gln) amidotransferase subunit C